MLSEKASAKELANKIIRNKHSPKRSGTEAACGLTNSFKLTKVVTKITMMKNEPDIIMSSNVNEKIIKDPWANLEKSNQNSSCDVCGRAPKIMALSSTQRSIRKGFL